VVILAKTVRIETRRRGIIGKLFSLIFWLFNGLMVLWLFLAIKSTAELGATMTTDAEQAGAAIGATLGFGMVLSIWAMGAIIFGLLSYMTRGSKVITETVVE
jgi:hypothetical protein